MGDRLLVWILDTEAVDDTAEAIPRMLARGTAERDRRGLNRFRLVAVTAGRGSPEPSPPAPEETALRVHLHRLRRLF